MCPPWKAFLYGRAPYGMVPQGRDSGRRLMEAEHRAVNFYIDKRSTNLHGGRMQLFYYFFHASLDSTTTATIAAAKL